jgi:hypothetical protein
MKYKIDTKTETVNILNSDITTPEIARLLDEMLKYEREKDFKTIKWKVRYVKKEISTSPIG